MDITAHQKFVHTAPRKMRLVVDMVRKMHPVRSMSVLQFTSQSAAKELKSVINAALANAKQAGLSMDKVVFKTIEVNEGPAMKRFRPGSKGRALPYKKRMSHVKIVLSDDSKGESVKGKEKELKAKNQEIKEENAMEIKEKSKEEKEEKKGAVKSKAKSKK